MEVVRGNSRNIADCLKIARSLPEYFTEEGIQKLGKDITTHQLFLAIEHGEVEGFLTLVRKSPHVAEISWLAIKPENQHKGYGSKMIDFITTELKNEGVRLLEVKTLAPGTGYTPYEATRNFYEKSGFMLMDIIDPYPGWEPGNPCALYVKIL